MKAKKPVVVAEIGRLLGFALAVAPCPWQMPAGFVHHPGIEISCLIKHLLSR